MIRAFCCLLVLALVLTISAPSRAQESDSNEVNVETLLEIIQKQQDQIDQLTRRLDALEDDSQDSPQVVPQPAAEPDPLPTDVMEILTAQQDEIDSLKQDKATSDTQIGGYGELHYNNLDSKTELDFHRFVLFFGHEFSNDLRFFSELELEHSIAGDGQNGEIELEQAYLEFDLTNSLRAKGGLFLVPVGFLNETHEPPTFYGVERNPVEKNIIPTTWWEGGAALTGEFGVPGLSFDAAIHSGLAVGPDLSIRGGRQKVSQANANNLAMSGRIKYTGIPGLELAGSIVYQDNYSQELVTGTGSGRLVSTQVAWNHGPLSLRALFARWDLDGVLPEVLQKDVQDGYYVEGAWKFNEKFGVFTRYNEWDNGGFGDTAVSQIDLGINFWPHRDVVIKFDIQDQGKAGKEDGFNLGIGYSF